ncbi:MAG: peptidase M20, partial [Gammaproteobacteria bacterium]|nr:peptidase M20 [Gammaproteobacteria bacterium]
MDFNAAIAMNDQTWEKSIIPRLSEYVRIPAKSPLFDPDWSVNGHMDKAADLMAGWCREQEVTGLSVE